MDRWKLSKCGFCDCEMERDEDGDYVLIDDVSEWLQQNGFEEASKAIDCEFDI